MSDKDILKNILNERCPVYRVGVGGQCMIADKKHRLIPIQANESWANIIVSKS